MHRAVLDRTLPEIIELAKTDNAALASLQLLGASVDNWGNTPLKLAVRTGDYQAIKLLLKLGFSGPKLRPCVIAGKPADLEFSLSAYELAVKIGDPVSIRLFIANQRKNRKANWKKNIVRLNQRLQQIPDFTFQCKWDCENSWVPFLHTFIPGKSYWLSKRGSCFRLTSESREKGKPGQTFIYDGERMFYLDE